MKIVHIITTLEVGGAETMLYKLLASPRSFDAEVIGLGDEGAMGDRLRAAGVRVRALHLRTANAPMAFFRLVRWLRASGADAVQTWMYHSDLIGGIAARVAGKPVIWNLRASRLRKTDVKRSTRLIIGACARLSHLIPSAIVCGSDAAETAHVDAGYDPQRLAVIPNGFDLSLFRPDSEARAAIRSELGVNQDTALVGLIARFDPLKDHRTFLQAAARVAKQNDAVRFVLVGRGVTADNEELVRWIDDGLRGRVHLLGHRADVAAINAALDVAVNSSSTEGFPNTVGEAMACGVPCVVTNVGDSAMIVGDTGIVVEPGDAEALAEGITKLLSSPGERRRLGEAARERVSRCFALPAVVGRYEALYSSVVALRKRGG